MKKKLLRVLLLMVLLCALLLAAAVGTSAYVAAVGRGRTLDLEDPPPGRLDCILVLGCSVHADGTPSPMLADRLRRAVDLYQAGWAPKLLMSGDNGQADYNEVAAMRNWAVEQGVPKEDIVLDYAGFSTYDSIYRARDIFQVQRMLVVTQAYHLYRALYVARALGIEAWGVAADGQNYPGQVLRDLREIAARDKDALWALFQPKPTFLGEVVPIG